MRYQNAVDNFEIIECGKILNETKIHFQGSKKLKRATMGFMLTLRFFLFLLPNRWRYVVLITITKEQRC